MARAAWQATVHRVTKSQTRLSDFHIHTGNFRASQVAPEVKNAPANAGDIKDAGLIPGLKRSPGGGMATYSSILAWRIPQTEEPVGYGP